MKWFSSKPRNDRKLPRKRRWWLRKRRIAIWTSVALLLGGYSAYEYATQPERLRGFAERELGRLLGARVTVGRAEASLGGVLLLADVRISTGDQPGDQILTAARLDADLKMSRLLSGDVVFEQVLLSQARLNLCEIEGTGRWNVTPLLAQLRLAGAGEEPLQRPARDQQQGGGELPQVLISQAEVVLSEIHDGKYAQRGSILLDAGLNHMSGTRYGFEIMGRSGERITPITAVVGSVDVNSGEVVAQLRRLSFDQGLARLLPLNVRRLLDEHRFAGEFRVPMLRYKPTRDGAAQFEVRVEFDRLGFLVYPRYLLSRREARRLEAVEASLSLMRSMNLNRPPEKPAAAPGATFVPVHLVDYLARQLASRPMELQNMAGAIVFTSEGIRVERLEGRFEGNHLVVDADLRGYDADTGYRLDGPSKVRVVTAEGKRLRIPPTPQFMTWMPDEVRKIYQQFEPQGSITLEVEVTRPAAGAEVEVSVVAEMFDSQFTYDDFPYRLYGCSGRLLFGREQPSGHEKVTIDRLRGHGAPGSVNEKTFVEVNGKVGPFVAGGVGVDLYVVGNGVRSEPALRAAFPREVKKAFRIFGPLDYAARQKQTGLAKPPLTAAEEMQWPRFEGNFIAHAFRLPGPEHDSVITLDLDIQHAWGTLKTFPYPLEDIAMKLHVSDDALTIENAHMKRGDATLRLDGTVKFGEDANPDLQVKTQHVAVDDLLLDALPPTERQWLRRSGLQGELDIAGRVFASRKPGEAESETDFDLALILRGGSIFPQEGKPAATELAGEMRLRPSRLEFRKLDGKRGDAQLDVTGAVAWGEGDVSVDVRLGAKNLLFDKSLYALLPQDAREAWDWQKPEGVGDVRLHYAGSPGGEAATRPATAELPRSGRAKDQIELEIVPRELAVTPEVFPYRTVLTGGEVKYAGGRLELKDVVGRHGKAMVQVSGSGRTDKPLDMRLKVGVRDLTLDKEFIKATPSVLSLVLEGIGAKGPVHLALDELHVSESDLAALSQADRSRVLAAQARPAAGGKSPASQPAETRSLDVDFAGRVEFLGSSMDIGLPVSEAHGALTYKGRVVADRLRAFDGALSFESYRVAGISGDTFSALLDKPQLKDQVRIKEMRTNLGGGILAGACTFEWYEHASSRYAVDLLLNNALVKEILPGEKSLGEARLTASLTAEGELSAKGFRRGRGDIRVTGEKMYDLPLVVGLSQVVTLGLPVSEPLNDMRVSYFLDNTKVTLENMELRSPTNLIQGRGTLDFKTRKIDMTLSTESPQKLRIPGLEALLATVKKELLEIRIRGTIQEPQVQAQSLPTFRATLDEVLGAKK